MKPAGDRDEARNSGRACCGAERVLGARAYRQIADFGADEGECGNEVDRGGNVARLLCGQLPVTQSPTTRSPAGKVIRECREATFRKCTRVNERHLLLDGQP